MAIYLKSKRGKRKLIFENYEYVEEREGPANKVYWQCSKKTMCKARAHTVDGVVLKTVNEHTHAPSAAEIEAKFAYNEIKEKAQSSDSNSQHIIGNVLEDVSQAALNYLPHRDSLKRRIRKIKAKSCRPIPLPSSLDEMIIPEEYRFTKRGDIFLLHDSGPQDSDRIIVFCTEEGKTILASSSTWYTDGTFKVVPELFYQLYTVHAEFMGSVVPVVYALMTRKTADAYRQLFFHIKTACPDARPSKVIIDFELAAKSAIEETFPTAVVRFCFFHFSQCIFRKIQKTGLHGLYASDPEFAIQCGTMAALALVPVHEIEKYFAVLQDYLPPCLDQVLDYLEINFIGKMNRRGRERPQFAKENWCHFETILNGEPKTNNAVEGWHRGFQGNMASCHPSIWKFLKVLMREESLTLHRVEQLRAGHEEKVKKVYRDNAARLKRLATAFSPQTDPVQYLRGCARNIQL